MPSTPQEGTDDGRAKLILEPTSIEAWLHQEVNDPGTAVLVSIHTQKGHYFLKLTEGMMMSLLSDFAQVAWERYDPDDGE